MAKAKSDKNLVVESEDSKGNKVTVMVRTPVAKDKNGAQLQYLKSFRQALENGAILKQKLDDHLKEQGIWDDAKQKRYEQILKTINDGERQLQKGGIKLEEAKDIAFSMKEARLEFRSLGAERTVMDTNTAESQADNASFDYLASLCGPVSRQIRTIRHWISSSFNWPIPASNRSPIGSVRRSGNAGPT